MSHLNSDELGEKGESRFQEFCADAKLTCNKSSRDRTGWDFLVEFPFEPPDGSRTLDKRRSAISCHLQVKTIWADSDRVSLRLSSAERLAKEPKPAFVYVLMINDALETVDSYLIHLRGKNLERILKRLRKAQASSELKINDAEITYDPKTAGVRLPPNGKALRDQLELDCGPDPQAYVASKAKELENLGFEKGRYKLKTTLQARNVDEFVEAFLGLRPLQATATESLEVRFGVPLPANLLPLDAAMKVEIKPKPSDQCTIRVYDQSGGPPAVFSGEVFIPPPINMPAGHFRARICTRFFTLDCQGSSDDKGRVVLATLPEVTRASRFSLDDWRNYLRLFTALGGEHTRLEVTPSKAKRFTIPMSKLIGEEQLAVAQELLLACDHTDHVLLLAGTKGGELSYQDLVALAAEIGMAYQVLTEQPEGVPISFSTPLGQSVYGPFDLLYVNWVRLANVKLAYGAVVTMTATPEADQLIWHPTAVAQPRASEIGDDLQAYRDFIADFKSATGSESVATREFENGDGVKSA
jgi:hypothetical protein